MLSLSHLIIWLEWHLLQFLMHLLQKRLELESELAHRAVPAVFTYRPLYCLRKCPFLLLCYAKQLHQGVPHWKSSRISHLIWKWITALYSYYQGFYRLQMKRPGNCASLWPVVTKKKIYWSFSLKHKYVFFLILVIKLFTFSVNFSLLWHFGIRLIYFSNSTLEKRKLECQNSAH